MESRCYLFRSTKHRRKTKRFSMVGCRKMKSFYCCCCRHVFFLLVLLLYGFSIPTMMRGGVVFVQAVVHELTPELVETVSNEKPRMKRYFVKMDAGPCHQRHDDNDNICRFLDKTIWEPLSDRVPWEMWTRLDCTRYPDLCNELSTPARVKSITGTRKVDFLTVAHRSGSNETNPTTNNNGRSILVELYRAPQASPQELVQYFRNMIKQNLPFEPMRPEEIEEYAHRRGVKLSSLVGGRQKDDSIVVDNIETKKKPVKLAVLVLTTDGFTRPDVWKVFAESGKDDPSSSGQLLRIFVHNKAGPLRGESSFASNDDDDDDDLVIEVPRVFSHRGTVALVRPVIQMLRFAVAYGGASHYVLVSGDSVPLWSAPAMIRELHKSSSLSNVSRFERHTQDEFKVSPELRQPYQHKELLKSKNWFLLDDMAARFFADPEHDYTHNFEILSMADEYYWINVAQEYVLSWTADLPVMYDEWPIGVQAERPHVLRTVDASKLRAKSGHLFARKISADSELILDWMVAAKDDDHDDNGDDSLTATSLDEL